MVSMQIATLLLAATGAGETILYDFQAEWCGPCKMMSPVVQQLAAEGYPVRKVDVDRDQALARRFGVTNIPCFVLVVNGQERGRLVGATSYAQLINMLKVGGVGRAGDDIVQSRGQSPDNRRGLFGSFGRRSPQPPAGLRPPRVELGQPVAAPAPVAATPPPTPRVDLVTPSYDRTSPPIARVEPVAARNRFAEPAAPTSPRSLPQRLLRSSVRLKIRDPNGFSFGSGTIIDYRPAHDGRGGEAVVLTCGHIFRDSQGNGAIHVDLFDQGQPQTVPGRMIKYDLQRDIGLISVLTDHPVPVIRLAPKDSRPQRGATVLTVGCDHGNDPTVQRSEITAINSFVGPPNLQVAGQPAVGRSGGGLFNQQGELIGVCNFADPTDRAGLYASVQLAHTVLQQSGRDRLAVDAPTQIANNLVQLVGARSIDNGSKELICIVRNSTGGHEVIVIDNASSDLLERIAAERQQRQGTYPTSMDVPDAKVIQRNSNWQPKWRSGKVITKPKPLASVCGENRLR